MVRTRMAVRRRTRSRWSWAALTVVPWCLAGGLLVSMAAGTGAERPPAGARLARTDPAPAMPGDLVPLASASERTGPAPPPDDPDGGDVPPRFAAKGPPPERGGAPRGDPAVGVRPTFAARLGGGSLARARAAVLLFGAGDEAAEGAGFAAVAVDAAWADPSALGPMPRDLRVTTRRSHAANSPQAEAGSTTPHAPDGSTPGVGRAVALASATPTEGAPIEIAVLPKYSRGPHGLVTDAAVGIAPRRPDYAALIETARTAPEQKCLAQAVYFEARSEPEEGQAAVAQVVLNRATSGLYPGSVCGVVFQNQQRRNACQFSFACEGHLLRATEGEAWERAVRVAREVTAGTTYVSDVGGATHYHADYVRPGWARALTRADTIGHHVFYTLKPGQS